ncbi:MAG TPA: hypothetical protein DCO86_03860 [Spirochaetaceae bacterium]|nr:hypothetical protein [Spirochaetaceae bacterium]
MKRKIAIIAMVAFVSVSSLFAASSFGGKARLRLGVKKDTNNDNFRYGMEDASDANFNFELLENTKNIAGKGSTYAEISAIAKIRFKRVTDSLTFNWNDISLTDRLQYMIGLNYANLVFDAEKNFKLGISGISPVQRYAQGWEVELDNGNTIGTTPFMTFNTAFKSDNDYYQNYVRAHGGWLPAMTLTYGKAALSLGLAGGYGPGSKDDPSYLVLLQGNDMVVSDGTKLSGNIGIFRNNALIVPGVTVTEDGPQHQTSDQTHLLYGAKLDYKKDDVALKIGATGNAKIASGDDLPFTDVDEANAIEASLNFAYTGDIKASIDAWFLDNQALWADDDEPDWVTYENTADLGYVYRRADGSFLGKEQRRGVNNVTLHKALSVRANVQPIDMLGITLRGQDLLNQCIIGLDAPIKVSDDLTITPTFEYTVDTEKTYADGSWSNNGEANPIIEGQVACNYKQPMYTIYGYIRAGSELHADRFQKDGKAGSNSLWIKPYLNIQTRNLIDGARLTFQWSHGTFNTDGELDGWVPSDKYHAGSGIGRIYVEARIDFK